MEEHVGAELGCCGTNARFPDYLLETVMENLDLSAIPYKVGEMDLGALR